MDMNTAPYKATRFAAGVREFLFTCAYMVAASDGSLKTLEQNWLREQFGDKDYERLLAQYTTLSEPDFKSVFDGLAATLKPDEKRQIYPRLRDWLRAFTAINNGPSKLEMQAIDAIGRRLRIDDELKTLTMYTAETVRMDGTPRVPEVGARRPPRQVVVLAGHTGEVTSVCCAPDGNLLLSTSNDGRARLWGANDGKEKRSVLADELGVMDACFVDDGKMFVASGRLGTTGCWKTESGELVWTQVEKRVGGVSAVDASPDEQVLATATETGLIILRRASDGHRIDTFGDRDYGSIHDIRFTPDGHLIAVAGEDKCIRLWDVRTGKAVHQFQGHSDAALCMAFTSDGDWMVSGGRDNTIRVWEMRTGQLVRTVSGHTFHVSGVALRRDNRVLATSSWDHSIKLWEMESGDLLLNIESEGVRFTGVEFLPDGTRLVAGCADKSVCVIPFELP